MRPMWISLVLLGAVFLGLVFFILRQTIKAQRRKRLEKITGVAEERSPVEKIAQKASVSKKLRDTGGVGPDGIQKGSLRDLIRQAGFETPMRRYWIYSAVTALVVFFVFTLWGTHILATLLFTVTGFLGLPRLWLRFKARRRQKAFLEEFADALDAMVRLLKAGMPVTEAIAMAGREFQGPVSVEMNHIYNQQRIGVSLADAAENAALRMPITEMQMFATAVAIQSETGASLSEVLTNLSGVIRARFKLKRKVVALSSEARTSAAIIGALPIIVAVLLRIVNPEYMNVLFEDRTGHVLLWGSGIWMSLGVLVMRQMIHFRI